MKPENIARLMGKLFATKFELQNINAHPEDNFMDGPYQRKKELEEDLSFYEELAQLVEKEAKLKHNIVDSDKITVVVDRAVIAVIDFKFNGAGYDTFVSGNGLHKATQHWLNRLNNPEDIHFGWEKCKSLTECFPELKGKI
jgi:hypothetical protein